jgi:hypothetical protein
MPPLLLQLLLLLLLLPAATVAGPWQECRVRIEYELEHHNVAGNVTRLIYRQRPAHLLSHGEAPFMATYAGCRHFCGPRPKPYEWEKVVDSLLTWILPLIGGLLMQVPFESNAFWATVLLLARWLGNPVVAIACTLWNIRVTSRCAALLDLSVAADTTPGYADTDSNQRGGGNYYYALARTWRGVRARVAAWLDGDEGYGSEPQPRPRGGLNAFSAWRDSLYILSVLNQYQLNYDFPNLKAFLGFALFSGSGDGRRRSSASSAAAMGDGAHAYPSVHRTNSADDASGAAFEAELGGLSRVATADTGVWGAPALGTTVVGDEYVDLNDERRRLRLKRAALAERLRGARRHGVVPILFSLMWFGVSMGISIEQAYGLLGANATAHNLALGLLMTWLPVLVACTLLDRNQTDSIATRKVLQGFFDDALRVWNIQQQQHEQQQQPRGRSLSLSPSPQLSSPHSAPQPSSTPLLALPKSPNLAARKRSLSAATPSAMSPQAGASAFEDEYCLASRAPSPLLPSLPLLAQPTTQQSSHARRGPPLVLAFSGQARRKWHYGVAHSILLDLEAKVGLRGAWPWQQHRLRGFLDRYDRGDFEAIGTVSSSSCASAALGLGISVAAVDDDRSIWYFDLVEAWQLLTAMLVVSLATAGAFVVSYNTPTVGIGCRSGGHMVFFLLSFSCFALEMCGWALHSGGRPRAGLGRAWARRFSRVSFSAPFLNRYSDFSHDHHYHHHRSGRIGRAISSNRRSSRWGLSQGFDCTGAVRAVRVLLTAFEAASCAWLFYILLAQTFGRYNSCYCKASMWSAPARFRSGGGGGGDGAAAGGFSAAGGYVDFENDDYYRRNYDIRRFWIVGTVLGCLPLLAVLYAVAQWCGQSFLWSFDYAKAMRGLRRVRRVRGLFLFGGW